MPFVSLLLSVVLGAVPVSGMTVLQPVPAQSFQEVIYMEVQPSARHNALQELRTWVQRQRESRSDLNVALLRELNRPHQFLLLAGSSKGLPVALNDLNQVRPSSLAGHLILPDFNLTSDFMNGTAPLTIPREALIMVAHLDADPSQREQAQIQLNRLGNVIPGLKGNQGVQILTWKKRPNHWTLLTIWKDQASYLAGLEDPHVRKIRAVIASYAAAPSDLRLYQRVD